MIPQHNYKLDAASLNSRHTGEVCDSLLYLHSVIFFSRHTSMCRTSYFCSLFQHSASSTLWDYFKMLMNFSKHSQFFENLWTILLVTLEISTHNYNMGSQRKSQYTLNVDRNYEPVSGVWHSGVKFSANCKGIEGPKFQRH